MKRLVGEIIGGRGEHGVHWPWRESEHGWRLIEGSSGGSGRGREKTLRRHEKELSMQRSVEVVARRIERVGHDLAWEMQEEHQEERGLVTS